MQVSLMMNKFYAMNLYAWVFSIGMWIMVAFVVSASVDIDFDFYGVSYRIPVNNSH